MTIHAGIAAIGAGLGLALVCASCATSHASDDLKLKAGGYSAVQSESMDDDDAGAVAAAAPSPASSGELPGALDGADYVADSDSVVKDLQVALVDCDSTQKPKTFVPGSETLTLDVGVDGKVVTVTPEGRQGLNDDIDLCLRRVAMGAKFAPLKGRRTSQFKVPVSFTRTPLKKVH